MSDCLSRDTLQRLHSGEITPTEAAHLEKHLHECANCAELSETVVAEHEELLAKLRSVHQAENSANRSASHAPTEVIAARSSLGPKSGGSETGLPELGNGPAIPGYQVVRELHRGGQGVIYQAVQLSTKRKVAIKVQLHGRFASRSSRRRFEREIELASALKHPNIISIFDSNILADGQPFYVMDYVRGVQLDAYVRDKKLSMTETLKLMAVVFDAVSYAHQKGVIHRDLKPSNILVDADGSPRVLDFGLAKLMFTATEPLVSMTGEITGTLHYMSPEQARGTPDEIDTRTDVYTLGVILYHALTGQFPYPVTESLNEVLNHIVHTPPALPSTVWKAGQGVSRGGKTRKASECPIDMDVRTILLKALSKDRERRYQSAGELANDVRRYLQGEPIEARRDSSWYVFRKSLIRNRVACMFMILGLTGGIALAWAYQKLQYESTSAVRLLQDIFMGMPEAIMTFDADTKQFIDANQTTLDLYGYTLEEFLQHKVTDITAEPEKTRATMAELEQGKLVKVKLRKFLRKDGSVFGAEIRSGKFILQGRMVIIGAVRELPPDEVARREKDPTNGLPSKPD